MPVTPRVSVIIATHNRAGYLGEAIHSVLGQTYHDWELIIVDDGSTDRTRDVVESYREQCMKIRYLSQPNCGLANTRAEGVALARGEYLAFLDDDDLFLPNKLKRQGAFMDRHPDVALVYSFVELVDAQKRPMGRYPERPATAFVELIDDCTIATHAALVRKACVERIGGFRQDLAAANDYDLWLRLSRAFPIEFLPECVALYRHHEGVAPRDLAVEYQARRDIYRRFLRARLSMAQRRRVRRAYREVSQQLAVIMARQGATAFEAKQYQQAARSHVAALWHDPAVGLRREMAHAGHALGRLLSPYASVVQSGWRLLRRQPVAATRSDDRRPVGRPNRVDP